MSRSPLLIVLVLVIVVTGCSDPLEGKGGEELYRVTCASCHGGDLSGGIGPAIGPGSNADAGLTDTQIRNVIKIGPGSMPGFDERLSEGQIDSLVAYLRLMQQATEGE